MSSSTPLTPGMAPNARKVNAPSYTTSSRVQQTQYLILYNLLSAGLWFTLLSRVVLLLPILGYARVHEGVGSFARWTQTLALMEVVHSAVGMGTFIFNILAKRK
jgi:hypothetical protein